MGIASMNESFAQSRVGRYFKVKERGSSLTIEILAGLTSFGTLCYIIPVNAGILADTGGPCPGQVQVFAPNPDPALADVLTPEYLDCQAGVKRDLITATAASSAIGCFLMGIGANMPILIAPAMGMNAYFAYTVVGFAGTGDVSYETALAAVLIEGIIFVFLAATGLRTLLAYFFPTSVKLAMTPGIGLFLTFIGLQASEGIGMVVADSATLVHLGGCPPHNRIYTSGGNYACNGHNMTSPRTWLGALGFLFMALLMVKKVRVGMLIGIVLISVMSWFRDTPITQFPSTEAWPQYNGDAKWEFFKQVVSFETIKQTAWAFDFDLSGGQVWIALITFLYTDLLDATGTMQAVARQSGLTDAAGNYPGQKAAFLSDSTSIVFGSMMGTSPLTAFAESSAGIEAGGRTGLTAITGAVCFFIALFFAPILSNIPPWATGGALLITGALMMQSITAIKWHDMKQAVPAFTTIAIMPLTYSIAYGIIAGLCAAFFIYTGHYLWELAAGRMTLADIRKEARVGGALDEESLHALGVKTVDSNTTSPDDTTKPITGALVA